MHDPTLRPQRVVTMPCFARPGWSYSVTPVSRLASVGRFRRRDKSSDGLPHQSCLPRCWMPAGEHTIEYRFRSTSFERGAWMSGASWLFVVGVAFGRLIRRRKFPAALTRPMARILITSGPTRQYLDPVRTSTNASSGRMGQALAAAAIAAGHEVIVVSGPVAVEYPGEAQMRWIVFDRRSPRRLPGSFFHLRLRDWRRSASDYHRSKSNNKRLPRRACHSSFILWKRPMLWRLSVRKNARDSGSLALRWRRTTNDFEPSRSCSAKAAI